MRACCEVDLYPCHFHILTRASPKGSQAQTLTRPPAAFSFSSTPLSLSQINYARDSVGEYIESVRAFVGGGGLDASLRLEAVYRPRPVWDAVTHARECVWIPRHAS